MRLEDTAHDERLEVLTIGDQAKRTWNSGKLQHLQPFPRLCNCDPPDRTKMTECFGTDPPDTTHDLHYQAEHYPCMPLEASPNIQMQSPTLHNWSSQRQQRGIAMSG